MDFEILVYETDIELVARHATLPGRPLEPDLHAAFYGDYASVSVMRRSQFSYDDFHVEYGCTLSEDLPSGDRYEEGLFDGLNRVIQAFPTRGALLELGIGLLAWEHQTIWTLQTPERIRRMQPFINRLNHYMSTHGYNVEWATEDDFWDGLFQPEDTQQLHAQALQRLTALTATPNSEQLLTTNQPLNQVEAAKAALDYERQLNRYNHIDHVNQAHHNQAHLLHALLRQPPTLHHKLANLPDHYHKPLGENVNPSQQHFLQTVTEQPTLTR